MNLDSDDSQVHGSANKSSGEFSFESEPKKTCLLPTKMKQRFSCRPPRCNLHVWPWVVWWAWSMGRRSLGSWASLRILSGPVRHRVHLNRWVGGGRRQWIRNRPRTPYLFMSLTNWEFQLITHLLSPKGGLKQEHCDLLPTVKVVAKPVPWALQVVFCSCKKSLRNGVPWCSCFLFLNQVSKRSKPEDFTRKPDGNQWTLLSLQHLYSLLRRTSAMQTPSFFGKHCEGLLLR